MSREHCKLPLEWCESTNPDKSLYCRGDCTFDDCKNRDYELLTRDYWCEDAKGCAIGEARVCVAKGRRSEVSCDDSMEKCPMQVDVNATNIGLTINQALSLTQSISKDPCRYFYCEEMMRSLADEALKAVPKWVAWSAAGVLGLLVVSTTLTIRSKLASLRS